MVVIDSVPASRVQSRRLETLQRQLRRHGGPITLLVVAVALWVTAMFKLRGEVAGQYGLLATVGGFWLLAAALTTFVAFVWAIASGSTLGGIISIGVVTLIYRVTATLLTDSPIYVWTYRHIGIVNYMIEGHASPNIQIYGDWPAFFAAMAWFSTVTGLDPVTVAHWFAPVAAVLIAALVGTLTITAGFGTRAALIATMLALVVNWTGQDYYSPQAVGLLLALSILTLLLHSRKAVVAGYMAIPLFTVLVATHQLTPFWLFFAIVGLAAFNQMRLRWLPLLFGAVLALYVIPRLNRAAKFDLFSGFNPLKNSAVVAEGRGSDGREFTILLERGLFIGLLAVAAVCFVVLWRRQGKAPWALGILAVSSMMILAGQDYGGEAIIRVYLYAIAGCAVLIAVGLAYLCTLESRASRIAGCVAATLVIAGTGAIGLQGYYGGWSYVQVQRSQLEQSRQLLAQNDGRLVIGTFAPQVGWPEGSTAAAVRVRLIDPAYDAVFDNLRKSLMHRDLATAQDVESIEGTLPRNSRARSLYVVIPRQLHAYAEYLGWFPPTFVPSLIELLSRTPDWEQVVSDDDTVIFAYTPKKK